MFSEVEFVAPLALKMEGVAKMMKNLQLSAAEKKGIMIGGSRREEKGPSTPQAIGKLLSEKPAPPEALIQSVGKIWCPIRGVDCKDLGENHFLFSFHQAAGKRKALEEGPWMLSNELLVMADFNGSKTLEEIEFSYIPIWVRVTNLPLGLLSKETGELLGDEIGEFMEADVGEDRMATGRFLRVKIRLDIRKPLMCGVTVKTKEEGPDRWCPVVYEHLPDFCYVCGVIGHTDRVCLTKLKKGETETPQFGSELRFRPTRRRGDGGFVRSSDGGGMAKWKGSSAGRWGSGSASGGGLSRSDGPSWRHDGSESKESRGTDVSGDKEVMSPLKIMAATTVVVAAPKETEAGASEEDERRGSGQYHAGACREE